MMSYFFLLFFFSSVFTFFFEVDCSASRHVHIESSLSSRVWPSNILVMRQKIVDGHAQSRTYLLSVVCPRLFGAVMSYVCVLLGVLLDDLGGEEVEKMK